MALIFNNSTTPNGRVAKILDFIARKDDFYFAIGRETPWGPADGLNIDDLNPPVPTGDEVTFENPIIYKKADEAVPIITGTTCLDLDLSVTPTNGQTLINTSTERGLIYVPEADITLTDGNYFPKPNAVYVACSITETDYTAAEFRSAAFFSSLNLETGITVGLDIYQPNEVASGVLDWISFHSPVPRDSNKTHTIGLIISF